MSRFIVRRLALMLVILAASSVIIFVVGRLAPGDPVQLLLGDVPDPQVVARVRRELGLDRPLVEQYLRFVTGALRGDLGQSYANPGRPISLMIGQAFPVTVRLAGLTVALAILLAVPLGVISAVGRGSLTDVAARLVALGGMSVPNFVVAILLILTLALGLHLVPVSGWGQREHYLLPVLALLIQPLAYMTRITRASVLQALGEDYVRTARSKGLPPRHILMRHVLPNAAIAIITVAGLAFSFALTGAFVVETIFRVPGMGQAAVGALFLRDYPMVQAVGLLYTAIFITMNLVADVLYALMNPRIRY
ncbi:MAG: ABC transporter permease [Armatimonadetes bacterium]|nr:ABC transporter permease [Armatimonadota bacterium]